MSRPRIHASELRQLSDLLVALLEDSDLMAELSLIEKDSIQGASVALRHLFQIAELSDMEDILNED